MLISTLSNYSHSLSLFKHLLEFLSLKTDISPHRWDIMSEKDKAVLQRKGQICLGATRESKIPIHNGSVCVCLTSPSSALTTSYRRLSQNPGYYSRMPKMKTKERANEGHIYISSAQSTFTGRRRKTEIILDCLKMYGVCRTKDSSCM